MSEIILDTKLLKKSSIYGFFFIHISSTLLKLPPDSIHSLQRIDIVAHHIFHCLIFNY